MFLTHAIFMWTSELFDWVSCVFFILYFPSENISRSGETVHVFIIPSSFIDSSCYRVFEMEAMSVLQPHAPATPRYWVCCIVLSRAVLKNCNQWTVTYVEIVCMHYLTTVTIHSLSTSSSSNDCKCCIDTNSLTGSWDTVNHCPFFYS